MSCHGQEGGRGKARDADLVIALVGNANIGKSAIFNQLTGLQQQIGNWPGKTVELAEGYLLHHGLTIKIIDLPGTYSLMARSDDEAVTRQFLLSGKADVIVDVVDATALERNLFLTVQLLGMGTPVVISLNLMDLARKKGIIIDHVHLQKALGTPVIPTVAVQGTGVHELVDAALAVRGKPRLATPPELRYGPEIEKRIDKLTQLLSGVKTGYPARWSAIKLLEGDRRLEKALARHDRRIPDAVRILSEECSALHQEPCSTIIASERYALVGRIALQVQDFVSRDGRSSSDRLDSVSLHPFWGYALMLTVMLSILTFMSIVGGWTAQSIEKAFESANPHLAGFLPELAWNGAVVGLYAALGVALGFILPFYLILSALENSGYLPRIAFLMDRPCHAVGLHGKASLPIIMAFGCNVPACMGCRIIENRRDRLIAIFLSTMVPCSARTVVILGIVGTYMGPVWAISLYIIDFSIIILLGKLLNYSMKGTSAGIIMEIPPFRSPAPKLVAMQAWSRFKPFLATAVPLIVLGSLGIEFLRLVNALGGITAAMSPITVVWLGLPAFTGVLFILGVLRKEAAVVLLATVAGTVNIPTVMTPVQMFVFSLVIILYIPCVATIAALVKETGLKIAAAITFAEIGIALLAGGLAFRILAPLL